MDRRIAGFKGEFLWELEVQENQTVALAEAFPAEQYGWRPERGLRSVSEVFVHLATGNFLLLDLAGARRPADLFGQVEGGVLDRLQAIIRKSIGLEGSITEKADVVKLLKRSLEAVREAFTEASDAELERLGHFFGEQTSVRRVYLRMLAHMNEHMGQAVAYARLNGVVPPWPDPRGTRIAGEKPAPGRVASAEPQRS